MACCQARAGKKAAQPQPAALAQQGHSASYKKKKETVENGQKWTAGRGVQNGGEADKKHDQKCETEF
jgi:hypothetical protein